MKASHAELIPQAKRDLIETIATLRTDGQAWDEITPIVGHPAEQLAKALYADSLNRLQTADPSSYAKAVTTYAGDVDAFLVAANAAIAAHRNRKAVQAPSTPPDQVVDQVLSLKQPTAQYAPQPAVPQIGPRFLTSSDIGWLIETARNAAREVFDTEYAALRYAASHATVLSSEQSPEGASGADSASAACSDRKA